MMHYVIFIHTTYYCFLRSREINVFYFIYLFYLLVPDADGPLYVGGFPAVASIQDVAGVPDIAVVPSVSGVLLLLAFLLLLAPCFC
jgi:hypothetical protein